MPTIIGVQFRPAGKIYYFDPQQFDPPEGTHVIAETSRGIEYATVVNARRDVSQDALNAPLKPIIRVATPEDDAIHERGRLKAEEAFRVGQEKIRQRDLEMKLVDVEYTFDSAKIIFYFTADGRIDFRELVKDLAGVFHTRIELRQIGVRDEAKIIGGIGICGRPLCCHRFLNDFSPVSIKMAKEQNLSLNPSKISGCCGRLLCCLTYENDHYIAYNKEQQQKRQEEKRLAEQRALEAETAPVSDSNETDIVILQAKDLVPEAAQKKSRQPRGGQKTGGKSTKPNEQDKKSSAPRANKHKSDKKKSGDKPYPPRDKRHNAPNKAPAAKNKPRTHRPPREGEGARGNKGGDSTT